MNQFPDDSTDGHELPTLQRIDKVCDAFEAQWLSGERPDIVAHVSAIDEPVRAELVMELVRLDVDYRCRAGDTPQLKDYAARLPDYVEQIRKALHDQTLPPRVKEAGETAAIEPTTKPNPPDDQQFSLATDYPSIGGYRITGRLGGGGMGIVWRAVQLSTGREVALKTIKESFASDESRLRFQREVELAARLDHSNIAQVFESGRDGDTDYFAMRLVQGQNLDRYVQKNSLDQREVLKLMQVVCDAVQHAHQRGVIHRDLKPANILVDDQGSPQVLDFGLAKIQLDESEETQHRETLTRDGQIAGTLAYMSPEQAAGRTREIDTRTDIYALGVMLYRLLTGQTPHDLAGSSLDVVRRIVDHDVRLPREFVPEMNRELEAILLKALAKQPAQRYGSANELREDLQRFLDGEPVLAHAHTTLYLLRKRAWKYRVPLAGVAALLFAIVGAVTFYVLSIRAERDRTLVQFQRAEQKTVEANTAAAAADQSAAEAREKEAEAVKQQQEAERLRELAEAARARAEELLYSGQLSLAAWALRDREFGYARETLGQTAAELRGWEFHYLDRLINQRQIPIKIGLYQPTGAAFSPDGSLLAIAASRNVLTPVFEQSLNLWNPQTGDRIRDIKLGDRRCEEVIYHPDGKTLVTAGYQQPIVFWNAETGEKLRELGEPCGSRPRLAIDPLGVQLAEGGDGDTVRLWNIETGKLIGRFVIPAPITGSQIASVAFSPDGKRLAAASSNGVRVWDIEQEKVLVENPPGMGRFSSVQFHPDNQRLLIGATKLALWDIEKNSEVWQTHHNIRSARFSLDGETIVAVDNGNQIHAWQTDSGEKRGTLDGHGGKLNLVRFSPSGDRVFGSGETYGHNLTGEAYLWNPTELLQSPIIARSQGGMAFTPDGQHLATIEKYYLPSGWQAHVMVRNPEEPANEVKFSPQVGELRRLAFHPDGKQLLIVPFSGDDVAAWDVEQGKRAVEFEGVVRPWAADYSLDGKQVVIAEDARPTRFNLYDAESGKPIRTLEAVERGHSAPVDVVFSPDGTRVFGCWFSKSAVWDVESGRRLFELKSPPGAFYEAIAYSPDGQWLAAATQSHLCVWDANTGEPVHTIPGRLGYFSVAFIPGADRLVTGNKEQRVEIWNVKTGRKLLSLKDQSGYVWHIFSDPTGQHFFTTGTDETVRRWNSGRAFAPLKD